MLKNFRTFHIAVEFYRAVHRLKLPGHLRAQLDRAASSVVLNLGEGAGRRSPADQRRFFDIAYASVKESQTVLYIAVPPTHPVFQLADKLAAHAYRLVERSGV